jgi:hypothetical protein
VRVAVISDLNGSYGDPTYDAPVHTAVRRIIAERPDVVLCTGDMVAGQRAGLDYEAMWAGFHAAVTDPLSAAGIPLAVSPGNHDASAYDGFENERRVYAATWQARRPAVEFVDGADYLGIGPCFTSPTKSFAEHAPPEFLRTVCGEVSLPTFAIGGITAERLESLVSLGVKRVAVASAVTRAADPPRAARELMEAIARLTVPAP